MKKSALPLISHKFISFFKCTLAKMAGTNVIKKEIINLNLWASWPRKFYNIRAYDLTKDYAELGDDAEYELSDNEDDAEEEEVVEDEGGDEEDHHDDDDAPDNNDWGNTGQDKQIEGLEEEEQQQPAIARQLRDSQQQPQTDHVVQPPEPSNEERVGGSKKNKRKVFQFSSIFINV